MERARIMTPAVMLAKEQARARREGLELAMLQHLKALGLDGGMVRQYQIDPIRKFAWDFCWPAERLALEVDGGTWMTKGAHSSGKGIERDALKQAIAAIHGYRTLRATTDQVRSGVAAQWVELARGVNVDRE